MMRKLAVILALLALLAVPVLAAEKTYHVTLSWEHCCPEAVDGWKLYWSETSGGPYEAVLDITNEPGGSSSFQVDRDLYLEGPAGRTVKKYFVLTAYSQYGESDRSEEASYEFEIPVPPPFSLHITVIARSRKSGG